MKLDLENVLCFKLQGYLLGRINDTGSDNHLSQYQIKITLNSVLQNLNKHCIREWYFTEHFKTTNFSIKYEFCHPLDD